MTNPFECSPASNNEYSLLPLILPLTPVNCETFPSHNAHTTLQSKFIQFAFNSNTTQDTI